MFGIALLTSALLALAESRIYERCELARDLLSFGISREHIATWVCIAFHESRFDTAARNPHSGDHGLLQISELYWCGAGKACSLPCSALRDDDISDDVECALRVHEEHTRLQGNGFLAWVVYPHHCKHNAKKYLADCDSSVKSPSGRSNESPRVSKSQNQNVTSFTYNPKIDELLPPYLTIGSLFRGNYEKEFEQNYNNKVKFDWFNYKIDNIDDLKLPIFNQEVTRQHTSTPLAATTTTSPSPVPKIKPPSPRRIESNSFRRRKVFEPVRFIETTDSSRTSITNYTPSNLYKSSSENLMRQEDLLQFATTTNIPLLTTTMTTQHLELFSSALISAPVGQTTNVPFHYQSNNPTRTTIPQAVSTEMTEKSTSKISSIVQKTTMGLVNLSSLEKSKPGETRLSFSDVKQNLSVIQSHSHVLVEPKSIWSSTSIGPTIGIKNASQSSPATSTSQTKSWLTWKTTSKYSGTTTSKPSSIAWKTATPLLTTVGQRNEEISFIKTQNQSTTTNSWVKPRVWFDYKTQPKDSVDLKNNTVSTRNFFAESTTVKPFSTTPSFDIQIKSSSKIEVKSTTKPTERPSLTTARTTQSIFDLYLNPTKRPKIQAFSLPPFKNRGFSLRIFAGGTTTHTPIVSKVGGPKSTLLVLSYPHFLYADFTYRNGLLGMNPVEEDHRIFVDLEPLTGTVVRAAKRAQFNIFSRPVTSISATQNLRTTLMPVFWIEEGLSLPEEYVNELKSRMLNTLRLIDILVPIAIALTCLVVVIGAAIIVRYILVKKNNDGLLSTSPVTVSHR